MLFIIKTEGTQCPIAVNLLMTHFTPPDFTMYKAKKMEAKPKIRGKYGKKGSLLRLMRRYILSIIYCFQAFLVQRVPIKRI
jgi:hypothetical protein